jgi:homoserine kinase
VTGHNVARAFAPASVGNVAVGFDLLGLALEGAGDTVTATRAQAPGVVIERIDGVTVELPREPSRNTAGRVAQALLGDHGGDMGVSLAIDKGIALGSGMGGSAASAVAAAVAVNALLSAPLPLPALLDYALQGEAVASGARHADNVAPSLLGGLVLAVPGSPAVRLPVPDGLTCVLARPHVQLNTRDGRALLREHYTMPEWVRQAGHLAGFIDACHRRDIEAIGRHLVDTLIEPQRKVGIPGFDAVRERVRAAGALACSISGSGPAMFAWCRDGDAPAVREAFVAGFAAVPVPSEVLVSSLNAPGATLLDSKKDSHAIS